MSSASVSTISCVTCLINYNFCFSLIQLAFADFLFIYVKRSLYRDIDWISFSIHHMLAIKVNFVFAEDVENFCYWLVLSGFLLFRFFLQVWDVKTFCSILFKLINLTFEFNLRWELLKDFWWNVFELFRIFPRFYECLEMLRLNWRLFLN